MFRIVRTIHLYASLTLMSFVTMYFVTGYVLTHGGWFAHPDPTETKRTAATAGWSAGDGEVSIESALELRDLLGLGGKPGKPKREGDGRIRIEYFRPGTTTIVTTSADGKSAEVVERRQGWRGTMVGFHRQHGYGGGWFHDLWAALFDLASAAMIVFGVTGVLMWHATTKRRAAGWALLALGGGFTLATIVFLMS